MGGLSPGFLPGRRQRLDFKINLRLEGLVLLLDLKVTRLDLLGVEIIAF